MINTFIKSSALIIILITCSGFFSFGYDDISYISDSEITRSTWIDAANTSRKLKIFRGRALFFPEHFDQLGDGPCGPYSYSFTKFKRKAKYPYIKILGFSSDEEYKFELRYNYSNGQLWLCLWQKYYDRYSIIDHGTFIHL